MKRVLLFVTICAVMVAFVASPALACEGNPDCKHSKCSYAKAGNDQHPAKGFAFDKDGNMVCKKSGKVCAKKTEVDGRMVYTSVKTGDVVCAKSGSTVAKAVTVAEDGSTLYIVGDKAYRCPFAATDANYAAKKKAETTESKTAADA